MSLPYAAEADVTQSYKEQAELSGAELKILEESYKRAAASRSKVPSQIKFNYAWGLVRSKSKQDKEKGIELFEDIYDEDLERRRECIYYLALAHYRLGNLTQSRLFVY